MHANIYSHNYVTFVNYPIFLQVYVSGDKVRCESRLGLIKRKTKPKYKLWTSGKDIKTKKHKHKTENRRLESIPWQRMTKCDLYNSVN